MLSKSTGYKVIYNCLYSNNEQSKSEIKKAMLFRMASKEYTILKNKCKTNILKNYKISLKETNNLNKWKGILCL